jgi:hypothetical protein
LDAGALEKARDGDQLFLRAHGPLWRRRGEFRSDRPACGEKAAKILAGTKPGDLPIEDAPEYAIVFNLKRAHDLGIEIPVSLLTAADAVYKDDLVPLEGRPLLYDPSIKSF